MIFPYIVNATRYNKQKIKFRLSNYPHSSHFSHLPFTVDKWIVNTLASSLLINQGLVDTFKAWCQMFNNLSYGGCS